MYHLVLSLSFDLSIHVVTVLPLTMSYLHLDRLTVLGRKITY